MLTKALLWLLGLAAVLIAAGFVAWQASPWPSALFFRHFMDQGGIATAQALEKHVPAGVTAHLNEHYETSDGDAYLDVYYPSEVEKTDRALPTIVWVHGGGFLSGSKDHIANYLKILAARGFTVVGINYSLAPGTTYPVPIRQANAALAYVKQHAARLHVEPAKLFLAGDSAGAQIAAQMANVISSPSYAKVMGISPAVEKSQLRGVVLHCGLYDPHHLDFDGAFGSFLATAGWSYFGFRQFLSDPRLEQFSVVRNVTADFPPMFISVGNGDGLAAHSYLLAEIAKRQGVSVDSLFFPTDYMPALPHQYQFNLDTEAGRTALERSVAFIARRSR